MGGEGKGKGESRVRRDGGVVIAFLVPRVASAMASFLLVSTRLFDCKRRARIGARIPLDMERPTGATAAGAAGCHRRRLRARRAWPYTSGASAPSDGQPLSCSSIPISPPLPPSP